ncbi:MAG TPA: class II glutamine amidotransferase [Syntrophorhabdaceae bacterium]|nr:class II glutamine amidotransferase [Syntrophorhabdaceae bacterium]HQJ95392.1 class II glutamine amidotransferase [Syntrophorhabdaceae bacterium]
MCRLLGLIANKPVDIEFSLSRFKEFSSDNPDGWGIGWYENNSAKVFKQGISAKDYRSQLPNLSKEVRSKIIIAHVRKGTGAPPSEINSHPFQYKNWLFAHNGSVDRDYLFSGLKDDYKRELKGKTDSEVYFYWILQCIEKSKDIIEGIKTAVDKIKSRNYSGLNFLLSDGKCIYSFRYSSYSKDYYSLWLLKRNPSEPGPLEFESKETKALLHSKSLKGERAVLLCSERLTKEPWEKINFGKVLIIQPDMNVKEAQIL